MSLRPLVQGVWYATPCPVLPPQSGTDPHLKFASISDRDCVKSLNVIRTSFTFKELVVCIMNSAKNLILN